MKRKNKRQGKRRKKEKGHSSTLKEVLCFYIKRENLSLEVNTAKLRAF